MIKPNRVSGKCKRSTTTTRRSYVLFNKSYCKNNKQCKIIIRYKYAFSYQYTITAITDKLVYRASSAIITRRETNNNNIHITRVTIPIYCVITKRKIRKLRTRINSRCFVMLVARGAVVRCRESERERAREYFTRYIYR